MDKIMSDSKKGWNRRMSDNHEGVPFMNGTVGQLTAMLAERIDSPEKQEAVTKELIKLQLNTWLLQKQTHDKLDAILKERSSILNKLGDKGFLFLYTVGMIILWMVFSNFKP
jgi:hypothetical protein